MKKRFRKVDVEGESEGISTEEIGEPKTLEGRPNIIVLGGGVNVGLLENEDGRHVPAMMFQLEIAVMLGKSGAKTLAEALANCAGLKVIEAPKMALVKEEK